MLNSQNKIIVIFRVSRDLLTLGKTVINGVPKVYALFLTHYWDHKAVRNFSNRERLRCEFIVSRTLIKGEAFGAW